MKPGWNRKGPTVHLDSTRDRINLRASKIHLQLEIPSLANGIVDFLRPFGTLYHGHLRREVFDKQYQLLRRELFQMSNTCVNREYDHDWARLKLDNHAEFQRLKTLAFWLDMMRIRQNQQWRWPAIGDGGGGQISLVNGRSRLLATGMTKRQPWKNMDFLIWVTKSRSIADIMDHPRSLQCDQDLHDVLDLQYDDQEYHQPEECHMGIELAQGQVRLQFFNNAFDPDFTDHAQKIWYNHVAWRKRYGSRPELRIYTNWPAQLRDSGQFWRWQVIGASQDFIDNLLPGKPGSIHWAMSNHVHGNVEHDHAMWIVKDEAIDLSDLVCWMDLEHTAFVDSEFRFALYRRDLEYSSVTVDITR